MGRDPRVEPRAGDWLSNGRADVRVDFTEGDSVFCVKWLAGEEEGYPFGIALAEFREQAAGSVVIAEGLPCIGAAWVFGEAIEVWRP